MSVMIETNVVTVNHTTTEAEVYGFPNGTSYIMDAVPTIKQRLKEEGMTPKMRSMDGTKRGRSLCCSGMKILMD